MARNYVFAPDEYYHVYARGVEKLPIYRSAADYQRFLESLYLLNTEESVNIRDEKLKIIRGLTSDLSIFEIKKEKTLTDIGAYCLMPNHFHILVKEKDVDGKGVSKFMQKLMTAYTMYFNKKYERTGTLFSSSFKAKHVTDDRHLKYLFAYIHLNPRENIQNSLDTYEYSSYSYYLGARQPKDLILQPTVFPDYFVGNHKEEIEEWVSFVT